MAADPMTKRQQAGNTSAHQRVLVVEDNWPIARALVETLEDLGVKVLGPANSLDKAMRLIEDELPSAALLDVDLGDTKVYPMARYLRDRKVNFALLTGYEIQDLPEDLRHCIILTKPICPDQLEQRLVGLGIL